MLNLKSKSDFFLGLLMMAVFTSCSNLSPDSKTGNASGSNIDSCNLALKFDNARVPESMVVDNYSGELNNYWGSDTTKLDFKHVFKNGELVKSYFYYENQRVQEEYTFKCGALHGLQKWYYENGKLAQTIPYSYGYKNGTGQLFDTSGRLTQKAIFRNDSMVGKPQTFDTLGNLIETDTLGK